MLKRFMNYPRIWLYSQGLFRQITCYCDQPQYTLGYLLVEISLRPVSLETEEAYTFLI